jgi:hypothetical protein
MGCDIHMYREVRDKDGTWRAFGEVYEYYDPREEGDSIARLLMPDTGRDYALFGLLSCGVRCEPTKHLALYEGLPEDVSPEVQAAYDDWRGDAHSPNWATLKDLDELWQRLDSTIRFSGTEETIPKEDVSNFFIDWVDRYMRPYAWQREDDVRTVFWFDS